MNFFTTLSRKPITTENGSDTKDEAETYVEKQMMPVTLLQMHKVLMRKG